MLIYAIVPPETAPQIDSLRRAGIEHPLAKEVLNAIRQRSPKPVRLWRIINALAKSHQPESRDHRRYWCLRFWGAVRVLLEAKFLYRHYCFISAQDFRLSPRRRTRKCYRPQIWRATEQRNQSVVESQCEMAGSNLGLRTSKLAASRDQTDDGPRLNAKQRTLSIAQKTQSAASPEMISAAAQQLAKLPRDKKRWSGWIGDTRCYRNMPIRLADGRQVFALGALRGKIIYTSQPNGPIRVVATLGTGWDRVSASEVKIIKNQAAQTMGQLKRGVNERKSDLKRRSAQANGRLPCRPGKHRGRPRRSLL